MPKVAAQPRKLVGEKLAWSYLQHYECSGCRALIGVFQGRVRVQHSINCVVGRGLRERHPGLKLVRV